MKRSFILCLLACSPVSARCQTFVNPETIQQPGNIYLQHTDVYYCPMAPPGPNDVRGYLSNVSDILRDPNGTGDFYRNYYPFTRDSVLGDTHPCNGSASDSLGRSAMWQRFFSARDKYDHSHSNIIVGKNVDPRDSAHRLSSGIVTVSKNEDVDFRASGTVKMENGFHVRAGAFFHAYQEPRWVATVFKDEFDSTALDRSKWMVAEGSGEGAICSTDSNIAIDTDYQATDGHVLDITLREVPDTCSCVQLLPDYRVYDTVCYGIRDTTHAMPNKYLFSSAYLQACSWPWNQADTPRVAAYTHAPYGKYEVREKLPHILHHTNNWGVGGGIEYDINESWSAGEIHPTIGGRVMFGPYKGVFQNIGGTVYFISRSAGWSAQWNRALSIIIDGIYYDVYPADHRLGDTVLASQNTLLRGGFPASLVNRTDSITFYYTHWPYLSSDLVPWKVTRDGGGKWRVFSAPYRILAPGDSLRFTKAYQPVTITLSIETFPHDSTKQFTCRWDSALNASGDTGRLLLFNSGGNPDSLHYSSDLLSYAEHYQFSVLDQNNSLSYTETPPVYIDTTTNADVWSHTPYVYHTFTMEWLPNEVRFLLDSNVVRRIPDRMIPPGSQYPSNVYFDWATRLPRGPVTLRPGEVYWDADSTHKAFFDAHADSCSGCWPVTIGGRTYKAAHHRIDYVKIWDTPADVKITDFIK